MFNTFFYLNQSIILPSHNSLVLFVLKTKYFKFVLSFYHNRIVLYNNNCITFILHDECLSVSIEIINSKKLWKSIICFRLVWTPSTNVNNFKTLRNSRSAIMERKFTFLVVGQIWHIISQDILLRIWINQLWFIKGHMS